MVFSCRRKKNTMLHMCNVYKPTRISIFSCSFEHELYYYLCVSILQCLVLLEFQRHKVCVSVYNA